MKMEEEKQRKGNGKTEKWRREGSDKEGGRKRGIWKEKGIERIKEEGGKKGEEKKRKERVWIRIKKEVWYERGGMKLGEEK